MDKQRRLEALKNGDALDFWGLKHPRCPHCGQEHNIYDRESFELYDEGEHEIECHACDLTFMVSTRIEYSFDTDEQPEFDEDDEEEH